MFTQFRQLMLPALGAAYSDAQKPVFGDAQKAQFLNDQNSIFNTQADSLGAGAARRGVTDSGAFASGLTGLGQTRAANASNYFSSIPFLNDQAKSQRTGNLLSLATNFLGRSPLGSTTTSNQSGTQQSSSQGNSTQIGAPAGSQFLNGLGGILGLGANGQGPLSNLTFGGGGGANMSNVPGIGGNPGVYGPVPPGASQTGSPSDNFWGSLGAGGWGI